ncbi:MAG: ArsR family transcriptional regulator [Planctomycetes bacterium]|nr:ArsR family transcriptional regulator [Planctomycetota bacterium]
MGQRERAVSEVASAMKIRADLASRYLRAMNARGILKARPTGRFVRYRLAADRTIPAARPLLVSLQRALSCKRDCTGNIFRLLTAFTHPRRQKILTALRERPMTLQQLHVRTRVPQRALRRHLMKLVRRKFVIVRGKTYHSVRPEDPLARNLLALAIVSPS